MARTVTSKTEDLRAAFQQLLDQLKRRPSLPGEPQWVFSRDGSGRVEYRLSLHTLVAEHDKTVTALGSLVSGWVSTHFPDHSGLVGTALGLGQIQPHTILWGLVQEAYARYEKFDISNKQVDELLEEVDRFFQSTDIAYNVFAAALNIHGPADLPAIPFPDDVVLRSLTDVELTRFYGGNPFFQHGSWRHHRPQFVFVTGLILPKIIGDYRREPTSPYDEIRRKLDRCLLALASFKEQQGGVGYESIRLEPKNFVVGMSSIEQSGQYVRAPGHGDRDFRLMATTISS